MSDHLNTEPALDRPDDFYEALIAAQSAQLNCRLILLMANHIGRPQVLTEALALAGRGLGARP